MNSFSQSAPILLVGTRFYVKQAGIAEIFIAPSISNASRVILYNNNTNTQQSATLTGNAYVYRSYSFSLIQGHNYSLYYIQTTTSASERAFIYANSSIPLYPYLNPFPLTIPSSLSNVISDAVVTVLSNQGAINYELPNITSSGRYGSATIVPSISVDTKGRVTTAMNVPILLPASNVTGLATVATSGSYDDLTNKPATLSDITSAGTYGSSTIVPVVTVDTKGRVTAASNVPIRITTSNVTGLSTVAITGNYTELANIPTYSNNYAIISSSTGALTTSSVTSTELGYLQGAACNIQNQLSNKLSLTGGVITGRLTINNDLYASNLYVTGNAAVINAYTTETSNVRIINQTGIGPGLYVSQKTVGGNGSIAEFYDFDNPIIPALKIADGGFIGIGTDNPQTALHVSGTIRTSLQQNRVVITAALSNLAVSSVTSTELGYLQGVTSNIQQQLNSIGPTGTATFSNIITSNLIVTGSAITPGSLGILGNTVVIYASNIYTLQNSPIPMSNITPFAYGTLDANGQAITINTDGVYRVCCLKAVTSSSLAQRTWVINKLSNSNVVLDTTTPAFTAIAGAEIGIRSGQKIQFYSTGQTQNWTNNNQATPSLFTIIPLTSGYPG